MFKAVMSMPGKAWAAGFIGIFVLIMLAIVFPVGAQTPETGPDYLDYDANDNGVIDGDELIDAWNDYDEGEITLELLRAVAAAFEEAHGWPEAADGASGDGATGASCTRDYVVSMQQLLAAGLATEADVLRAIACWLAGLSDDTPTEPDCTATPKPPGCPADDPTPEPDCTATPTPAGCETTLPQVPLCELEPNHESCQETPAEVDCTENPDHADCQETNLPGPDCTATPTPAGCSNDGDDTTEPDCTADPKPEGCPDDSTPADNGNTNNGGGGGGGGNKKVVTPSFPTFNVTMGVILRWDIPRRDGYTVTITPRDSTTDMSKYEFRVLVNTASTGFRVQSHPDEWYCPRGDSHTDFVEGSEFVDGHTFNLIRCGIGDKTNRGFQLIARRKGETEIHNRYTVGPHAQALHPQSTPIYYSAFEPPANVTGEFYAGEYAKAAKVWNDDVVANTFQPGTGTPSLRLRGFARSEDRCGGGAAGCWILGTEAPGRHIVTATIWISYPPYDDGSVWTLDSNARGRTNKMWHLPTVLVHEFGHAVGLEHPDRGLMGVHPETGPPPTMTRHDMVIFTAATASLSD